jgi:hypothetical protein
VLELDALVVVAELVLLELLFTLDCVVVVVCDVVLFALEPLVPEDVDFDVLLLTLVGDELEELMSSTARIVIAPDSKSAALPSTNRITDARMATPPTVSTRMAS